MFGRTGIDDDHYIIDFPKDAVSSEFQFSIVLIKSNNCYFLLVFLSQTKVKSFENTIIFIEILIFKRWG
jgi:hypothetical protein